MTSFFYYYYIVLLATVVGQSVLVIISSAVEKIRQVESATRLSTPFVLQLFFSKRRKNEKEEARQK